MPVRKLARPSAARRLHGNRVAADTEATGLIPQGPWRNIRYDFGAIKEGRKTVGHIYEDRLVCPARPFAFSFADMDCNTEYYQWDVDPMTREVIYDTRWDSYKRIQDIVEDDRIEKWLHNPRYDWLMYQHVGMKPKGKVFDTQILAHIATAGQELTYALKPLTKKWVDYDDGDEKQLKKAVQKLRLQAKKNRWAIAVEALAGKDPWKADMWLAPQALTKAYAVGDVIRCILLIHLWLDEVQADERMTTLFNREHELMWTLKDMEDAGTRVYPNDVRNLREFYLDYQQKQVEIANANGGAGLNYGSTVQMAKVFYEQRGHPAVHTQTVNKKTGKLNYSLNGDQLVKMATGYVYEVNDGHRRVRRKVEQKEWVGDFLDGEYRTVATSWKWVKEPVKKLVEVPPDPLAKAVLEFKGAKQTVSSFLDVYERYWVKETWNDLDVDTQEALRSQGITPKMYNDFDVHVLHPGYKQTGTITGRLSCSDPNLMQVASETTGRRKADIQSRPREAFGPRPGCYWYLPDYSQIEVWLFAFLSGEEKMQETLLSGAHFHTDIATKVFGTQKDFKEHKEYYVKCAKLIMFAKLYGGGISKIAGLLKSSQEAAKAFIEQYEAELPGVPRFMKHMINRARRDGVIYSPLGRRYTFEPHFAYTAVNYLIQGTAADVMKNALIRMHRVLKDKWRGVRLLLTIHDEICVEVPACLHSQDLMRDVVRSMQGDQEALGLPVPLPVEMKVVRPDGRWNKTTKFSKKINDAIGAYTKAA